ncbi:MAG: RIP metalloprotease RseP [Gammaproteobacteria bacterium]|nr:RIP metalloprotease RseP [Gammaproteobacteria bacterium]
MVSVSIFILSFLLTILIIIGLHEFGHFIAARLLGVRVLRFSIGFGRVLFSKFDQTGTEYALSAIPLGGYVKLLGEEAGEKVPKAYQAFTFHHQAFWKKFIIIAAGPLVNFVLALFLYWLIFMIGFTSVLPVIGKVTPHSIAAEAGLLPKQEIIQIDHTPVSSWMSVVIRILSHTGNRDTLIVTTRSSLGMTQEHILNLTTWKMDNLNPDPIGSLGIEVYAPKSGTLPPHMLHHNQYGPVQAFSHAWQNTRDFIWLNFDFILKLITGKVSLQSLGGPISIFSTAGAALHEGLVAFMSFLAFLSIAIGIINILPIPGLDGGHLLFQCIERVIGRPIPDRIMLIAYRLGIVFIILLSIQAIFNDIMRL